jgi:hypothetical protein
METYKFYPPRLRSRQVPYHEIVPGSADCQHQLAEEAWLDRISVRDALVFVTYTCEHCGRRVCQTLEQVLPPAAWTGWRD